MIFHDMGIFIQLRNDKNYETSLRYSKLKLRMNMI